MSKSLEKYTQFLSFLAFKYDTIEFDELTKDMEYFDKDQKGKLFNTTLDDEYKTYIDNNESELDKSFNEKNSFKTNVRGLKIRGCFPSQQEAELRCKMLREIDPNHDVYVGPVGMWIPFHPEAYKTGRVEYLEDELNQLMNEKQKNEKNAKNAFDTRVKDSKKQAIEDNKEKALASGNVLTQNINEQGELMSINSNGLETTTENVTIADVRSELFEGDNIVTDKNTDHGLSELTINKKDLMTEEIKDSWRDVIINNYPTYTEDQKSGILKYNLEDVIMSEKLFYAQLETLSFNNDNFHQIVSQAIFHGRAMGICA